MGKVLFLGLLKFVDFQKFSELLKHFTGNFYVRGYGKLKKIVSKMAN